MRSVCQLLKVFMANSNETTMQSVCQQFTTNDMQNYQNFACYPNFLMFFHTNRQNVLLSEVI